MSALEHVIPEGNKQTEVGLIPNDWFVKTFGQVMSIRHGKDQKAVQVPDGCYPIFGTGGKMGTTNTALYDKPSVLIGRKGTINKPRYIDKPFWTVDTLFYSEVSSKESAKFIYYKFCMIDWMQYNEASGVPSLNARTIESVSASFPELIEQIAIANALSDVDALLTELEKLIAKKQAIKTATMQQLLTGKTRLPQFATYTDDEKQGQPKGTKPSELGEIPEDWDVVSIAKLTRNIIDYRGRTPKKLGMDWGGGDIVALSAGNVKKGYIDFEEECYLGSEELYKKWMKNGDVEQNDIVFTMEAPLGNVALIPDSKRYILSQRTILLQLKREEYKSTFVYQLMMSDQFQKLLSDSATGSTAQGIKRTRFEQLLLCLPSSKEEQTTIATILSDMDNEIQTLEQRLAKTRQIKQGMMQQLLTGRTRLPFKRLETEQDGGS